MSCPECGGRGEVPVGEVFLGLDLNNCPVIELAYDACPECAKEEAATGCDPEAA